MAGMKEIQQKTALYKIRKARGMSQKQLAEAVNASNQQISCLENGDRKLAPEWIERLSKALNCSKGELLGETPLSDDARAVLDMYERLTDSKKELAKAMLAALIEKK